MNLRKTIPPSEVDFWLDNDRYSNFFEERTNPSNNSLVFSIDMVRLSSIRKAISNFVRILTRKSIPVYFNDFDANVNFGGKVIYISAEINSKQDFDIAVGQALHEGAHTLKTDFDVVKISYANIPPNVLKISDSKNIRRQSLEKFILNTWNVIEDRFIDNYVFNEAPGYRGYYVALYNRFWNCSAIDEFLKSDMFRYPSLDSYSFRITNFTNLNTDLLALPRLEEIAKVIDISNIDRLEQTKDRIKAAFKVTEIVLDCLDKEIPTKTIIYNKKIADPRDYFDFGDDSQSNTGEESNTIENEDDGERVDVGKRMVEEISDVLNKTDPEPGNLKENTNIVHKISADELDENLKQQVNDVNESQRNFLNGELPKQILTNQQKVLLDLIEKHDIILSQVKVSNLLPGNNKSLKINCIIVQKMTKELILSGTEIFPLCGVMKMGLDPILPPEDVNDAVKKGIRIGTKLGRKLQIRSEVNLTKSVRKKSGKINKRQLHEAAFDADDLFYKIRIEEYHKANLHITVDASSSMKGQKWIKTMTSIVAICKAASMIDNINVTVSFRSTQESLNTTLPYIILAYNSRIDKFSKIRTLFPYLIPNGCTPEGLAFGATMNLFENTTPDETERYFLNISDGEPYYILNIPQSDMNIHYMDEVAVHHTKEQIDKIRKQGISILSYFIEEDNQDNNDTLHKNFHKMYGKDAKFIGVNNIIDLAKTLNDLFLTKCASH